MRFRTAKSLIWLLALPLFFSVAIQRSAAQAAPVPPAAAVAGDYSGMYSFLKDGEFLQIGIADTGAVSGYISRFGDSDSDSGTFLNQFFKLGKSDGSKLSFTTESVHGVWFTFEGAFERGPGKKPDEESYYLLRGALTRFSTDAEKKVTSQVTQVEFRSFPRDAAPPQ
jgi:hypothetical protein